MASGIVMPRQDENGFSLIEVMFALAVLLVGVLGAAAVLTAGMQRLGSASQDVVGTQKAAQAIEAVFAARDSHTFPWAQIRNITDNGIFLDGPQPLKYSGIDGLVNTADDAEQAIESTTLPGIDQILDTADDTTVDLRGYTREIAIREVPNSNGNLRSITVTITYDVSGGRRTHTLTTYISAYS